MISGGQNFRIYGKEKETNSVHSVILSKKKKNTLR